MKKVFIASFMYAPKGNGKTGGNQAATDTTVINDKAADVPGDSANLSGESNEQSENADDDSQTGDKGSEGDKKTEVAEPTSEKLLSIRADIERVMGELVAEPDMKKKLAKVEEVQKLQHDEKAEQAAIKKAILDEKIAANRNARIALVTNVIDIASILAVFMATEFAAAPEVEKADEPGVFTKPADILARSNDLNEQLKAAREVVVNELLGKPAKVADTAAGTATQSGEKGETSKAIIARYEALIGEGVTDTEARKTIIKEGFSRGTTGAVVLAYRKEKGLVD